MGISMQYSQKMYLKILHKAGNNRFIVNIIEFFTNKDEIASESSSKILVTCHY